MDYITQGARSGNATPMLRVRDETLTCVTSLWHTVPWFKQDFYRLWW